MQSADALRIRLRENGSRTDVLSGPAGCRAEAGCAGRRLTGSWRRLGAAGWCQPLAAIRAEQTVLLANKESLVTCGRLFMDATYSSMVRTCCPWTANITLIFRVCLQPCSIIFGYADLTQNGVSSILLTGSGGPFPGNGDSGTGGDDAGSGTPSP